MQRYISATVFLFVCYGTHAKALGCSLALVLALDVSVSVDDQEYRLQRDGLAVALLDPEVTELILARSAPVSLMAYEWSGVRQQEIVAPWQAITSQDQLIRFAAKLAGHDREDPLFPTAIGPAIGFGLSQLETRKSCERLVLDVSGDGSGNDGFAPSDAYNHFPTRDLMVNGLVILGSDDAVIAYYQDEVLYGYGAFIEIADGFDDYAAAMKRKLLRELAPPRLALK